MPKTGHPMPEQPVERIASRLNEEDKLLLFGDLAQSGKPERKLLWRSVEQTQKQGFTP